MYLVPKINLFHALKLGPQSKESANFFNKSWVIDGTMIIEEYLGATDGAARSPRLLLCLLATPPNHSNNPGLNYEARCVRFDLTFPFLTLGKILVAF